MPCEDTDTRRKDYHVTIETLNNLKTLIKMQRLTVDFQKQDTIKCYLWVKHMNCKDTERLRVNGQSKIYHAISKHNKAGVAILISVKRDFETENIITYKER